MLSKRSFPLSLFVSTGMCALGCVAGAGDLPSGGSGNNPSVAGANSFGGASAGATAGGAAGTSAGATTSGGTFGSGGTTGGASSTGGASATGGVSATGGTSSTGGSDPGTGGTGVGGDLGAGGTGGTGGTTGGTGSGGGGTGGTSAGGAGTGGSGGGTDTGPIGFATLNGGTTGGKAGQVVTASSYAQLKSYAESSTAYTIMVSGTISNGSAGGVIAVKANKSLIGVGSTAFLSGVGLDINNANNIVIQNLRISLVGVTPSGGRVSVNDGDAIGIRGSSKNVWIDHCEIFSEDPAVQTDIDLYDGLIDIKGQTGFITISWNYLHDHHKGGLVGASDSDLFDDRKITFHHNYYDNVKLRVPMYRGSVGHFFNNYIVGAEDATEIREGTCVRVEKNYYEALHFSIYTPSDHPGSTQRIDNIEISHAARAYPANCTADIPYTYANVLTNAADVKTLVPQGTGVGKI